MDQTDLVNATKDIIVALINNQRIVSPSDVKDAIPIIYQEND